MKRFRQPMAPDFMGVLPITFSAGLLLMTCAAGRLLTLTGNQLFPLPETAMAPIPWGFFILVFAFQWVLCMTMLLLLPRFFPPKQKLCFVFAVALICRLILLPEAPSDDMNRYLWEGKVLSEGISPYRHAPGDPFLAALAKSDPYHGAINHPEMTAAYPPLMIALFSALGSLWYHPMAIKGTLMLMDLGTMVFLAFMLSYRRLDFRWLALYAFNPVILQAFAAEGHFDVLQCFCLAGALCFYDRKKWGWMFLLAGLSIQVKYVTTVTVLFFINRKNFRYSWIALFAAFLPYALFLWAFPDQDFWGMVSSLLEFGERFAFNGSFHALLRVLFGEIKPATAICQVLLAILWVCGLFYFHPARNSRYGNDPIPGCFFILGCAILLAPTVHFWYISWIIPFLVLQPSKPWIILCLTTGFYFVTYGIYQQTGLWRLPTWAYLCEWVPLYALLMIQGAYFLKQIRTKQESDPPETVSVVIPALNEEKHISASVGEALKDHAVSEVIVVDGGSSDQTRKRALDAGARVLRDTRSPEEGGGRGGQICKGIAAARGDLVAVVHADTLVKAPGFTRMCHVLERQPRLCGGTLGGVFKSRDPKLALIDLLNDLRATFLGIGFGDQVQFFRRKTVSSKGLFPCIPIMEDVEFSLRLAEMGPQVHLFGNALVSPRRWDRQGFENAFTVIKSVATYLLKRIRGIPDTKEMYRSYYKTKDLSRKE